MNRCAPSSRCWTVFNRNYAVVQGVVLVTATTDITLNLLADLAYFAANPRLRS